MTKKKIYKFYDTSSLLIKGESLFNDEEDFIVISSITLSELEEIKTSKNKDNEIKFAARKVLRLLADNPDKYKVHIYKKDMIQPLIDKGIPLNHDAEILATAIDYDNNCHPDETIFVTNDLSLMNIANLFFGKDSIISVQEEKEKDYDGYLEVCMSDEEMTEFYSNQDQNIYNLYANQYINVYNKDMTLVDTLCWTGKGYRHLTYKSFTSTHFGEVRPMKGDIYQAMLFDSLINNQITMVKGKSGGGKTSISLAYLMHQLERGKIDKIIIFCNTIATKNSAKLGLDG